MLIQTFFKSLTSTSTRRRPIRRRPPASRPCLEALADRCLPSFLPAVNYPVGSYPGSYPSAVVTGDFNGDGRLDIAVANETISTMSILLGNGDGTFQPAQNFAGGGGPRSLAVGDFNGDGKLDLVTANFNDVSVLLGNGNGTFQAPTNIPFGTNPESVAVGDFHGDGQLDLAVGSTEGASYGGVGFANVLLGNGDGTFAGPHTTRPAGISRPRPWRTSTATANSTSRWPAGMSTWCWATALATFWGRPTSTR